MLCPKCETENAIGATYCAGCGEKLEITDEGARVAALESVRHDAWEKTSKALNRTLSLFFLVFVLSLIFNAYASRPITAEFNATAAFPPATPLTLDASFIKPHRLPVPDVPDAPPLVADRNSEAAILADLASAARDRLDCSVYLKDGGVIPGVLLSRTEDEIRLITKTGWRTPIKVYVIKISNIDFEQSTFPE